MSYVATRNKYHVALNGVGLMLQGAPDRPGYQQGQAAVYGNRFASGDRDYNDLSQWWYFVQTDWSGGIKSESSWANDAKYYYSTNIDTWSESGAIKLCRKPTYNPDEDFTGTIACGYEGEVNGAVYKYIGTSNLSDDRPHIYQAAVGVDQTFTDISTTTIATNQNIIAQISARMGILWASVVGIGSTWVVATYNGTAFTDQSPLIEAGAALTNSPASSRCHAEASGIMYVFVDNALNNQYALVKTAVKNPTANGDWSLCFEALATEGIPMSCAHYNGNIYYLVNYSGFLELWQYNIASTVRTNLHRFNNTNVSNWSVGDKMLVEMNSKLIITIPNNEIWELNDSSLSRIFLKDEYKRTASGNEIDCYLYDGCVVQDNKAWWGNLMYDGESFYSTWKDYADSTSNLSMLFGDTVGHIWWLSAADDTKLYSTNPAGSSYKGTDNKNFIVFSNFDNVAGVDKLGYSAIILFRPLVSGQSIEVEYFTGEFSTSASWTSLGSASYAVDGGTIRSKTFFFAAGTTFNKIWFRVKLEGGGSNTPVMNDLVMEYLPVPTYKKTWVLSINAANELRRLDGELFSTTGRELKSQLEQAWWTKSLLDFQDLDYATTTLSDNPLAYDGTTITAVDTIDFPDKGRIKIDNEEIFYTGKTPTTFTGCTRGARGTVAVAHSQNAVVNNAYKVLITDFNVRAPIILKEKSLEYIITLTIREG